MVQTLLRALQLFKENRLGGVIMLEKNSTDTLPSNFQNLLSLKIEDLSLKSYTKKYIARYGVLYVGEVYRIKQRYFHTNSPKSIKEIDEYLVFLGLPLELDPIKAGWIPPYWHDTIVCDALHEPIITHTVNHTKHHLLGIYYFGQIILSRRSTYSRFEQKQQYLEGWAKEQGLHGAMYLMEGWTALDEVPEACQKFLNDQEERQRKAGAPFTVERVQSNDGKDHSLTLSLLFTTLMSNQNPFSVRTSVALNNANIIYWGQLIQCEDVQLLKIKNFGRKSLREVKFEMTNHELSLGLTSDDHPNLELFNRMLKVTQPE